MNLSYIPLTVYATHGIHSAVEASTVYKCIADSQRLRILNLLQEGPLCVCHLQELLDEGQVKISKQLATLKRLDLVTSTRDGNWMVYAIADPLPGLVRANLDYLREACCEECALLQQDRRHRHALMERLSPEETPLQLRATAGCDS